jgi:hypothetical protein
MTLGHKISHGSGEGGSPSPVVLQGSRVRSTLVSNYVGIATLLGGLAIIFSLSDILTSAIALGRGLQEGNVLLLALSSLTGIGLIDALGITKFFFLLGLGVVFVIGLRTKDSGVRFRALMVLLALAVLLLAVSINNLYLISISG